MPRFRIYISLGTDSDYPALHAGNEYDAASISNALELAQDNGDLEDLRENQTIAILNLETHGPLALFRATPRYSVELERYA